MSAGPKRLLRLARAQSDLAELLEARIAAADQRGRELAERRAGTLMAVERMSTQGLVFYAAALRRLAEIDGSAAEIESMRRALLAKLIQARGRQEVLLRRAQAETAAMARKAMTEETGEAVLAMQEKAPGKGGVMK